MPKHRYKLKVFCIFFLGGVVGPSWGRLGAVSGPFLWPSWRRPGSRLGRIGPLGGRVGVALGAAGS